VARSKKSIGSDAKLARLHALSDEPVTEVTTLELRGYLADASSILVAEAAKVIRVQGGSALAGDLAAAFDRFMIDPEESDKQCRASPTRARMPRGRCEPIARSAWCGSGIPEWCCC
jgi:hypothetical protein